MESEKVVKKTQWQLTWQEWNWCWNEEVIPVTNSENQREVNTSYLLQAGKILCFQFKRSGFLLNHNSFTKIY